MAEVEEAVEVEVEVVVVVVVVVEEVEVVEMVGVVVAARRACIRSVATIETPTIVKPRMIRGTQSLGNVQQSCPGWPRPEPRRAVAVSTLKPWGGEAGRWRR